MGIFKRSDKRQSDADGPGQLGLGTMLLQGEDMIEQLARAHASWGCGTAQRWGLDQQTGLITWTFADKTATAPAQILASYNPASSTWLWAWANESILPAMSRDARGLRDWAQQHGHHSLTQAELPADGETAATLAALAVRITRATGVYRPKDNTAVPIITFGPVTLTTNDGTSSTFTINIDEEYKTEVA